MELRGLLWRKLHPAPSPELQQVYKEELEAEKARLQEAKQAKKVETIRAKARQDAKNAMTPGSVRVLKGLHTAGKKAADMAGKIDIDKLEANVTGKPSSGNKPHPPANP